MSIVETLSGGDPRSLGKTEEVVADVSRDKKQLNELFECLFVEDEIVRMRASDALEKVCRQHPEWFESYINRLLNDIPRIKQPSVQWHLAQMFCEISLDDTQKQKAVGIMKHNLQTMDEWVVTNLTLESLAHFARAGYMDKSDFIQVLKPHRNSRHKSVVARTNKLLKEFES